MLKLEDRISLPSDFVVVKGEFADAFYLIRRGYCALSESQRMVTFPQGGSFGESALVSRARRTASVYAVVFCEFCVLRSVVYSEIAELYPDSAQLISDYISQNLAKFEPVKPVNTNSTTHGSFSSVGENASRLRGLERQASLQSVERQANMKRLEENTTSRARASLGPSRVTPLPESQPSSDEPGTPRHGLRSVTISLSAVPAEEGSLLGSATGKTEAAANKPSDVTEWSTVSSESKKIPTPPAADIRLSVPSDKPDEQVAGGRQRRSSDPVINSPKMGSLSDDSVEVMRLSPSRLAPRGIGPPSPDSRLNERGLPPIKLNDAKLIRVLLISNDAALQQRIKATLEVAIKSIVGDATQMYIDTACSAPTGIELLQKHGMAHFAGVFTDRFITEVRLLVSSLFQVVS